MNIEDKMLLSDIKSGKGLKPLNKNGVERLSGDYIRGYTKAIMDLKDVFNYVHYDLRHHRKQWTKNIINKLFNCCIDERENIRENKEGFIRYNNQICDFEFYNPAKQYKEMSDDNNAE